MYWVNFKKDTIFDERTKISDERTKISDERKMRQWI